MEEISSNLVVNFFWFQNNLKIYHWQTNLYARHKASDKLFGKLNESIDKFIEVFSGIFMRPKLLKNSEVKLYNVNDESIIEVMKDFETYLRGLDNTFPEYSELLNIRDEILADLDQTRYLFSFQ
jgi:hypothetical protein